MPIALSSKNMQLSFKCSSNLVHILLTSGIVKDTLTGPVKGGNLGLNDTKITLPLYMAMFI